MQESYKPLKGLIHHYEDAEPADYRYAAQGLHVTKFGRGFRRKIVPPPVDLKERELQQVAHDGWSTRCMSRDGFSQEINPIPCTCMQLERERRAEEHAARRREFLRQQQQRNGVQVITAEPLEGYHHKEHRRVSDHTHQQAAGCHVEPTLDAPRTESAYRGAVG